MSINEALKWGAKKLDYSCSPSLDAEVLLLHVLSPPLFSPFRPGGEGEIERGWLYANPEHQLSKLQATSYKLLIKKRARHWPVAYLVGHKEFFGLDFKVTPSILIPRPETELLVELALQKIFPPQEMGRDQGRSRITNIIDLGTGSGNIIISLAVIASPPQADEAIPRRSPRRFAPRDDIRFYATDSSPKALQIAKLNARRHSVAHKIKFLRGHLLNPFLKAKTYKLKPALIAANLPYGWKEWKNNTSSETIGLKFEPRQALFTKEQGLYLIHRLFKQLHSICHPRLDRGSRAPRSQSRASLDSRFRGNDNITVLLEFDPRQKQKLQSLAKKYFPRAKLLFHKDLSGRYRVMEIRIFLPHDKGEIKRG